MKKLFLEILRERRAKQLQAQAKSSGIKLAFPSDFVAEMARDELRWKARQRKYPVRIKQREQLVTITPAKKTVETLKKLRALAAALGKENKTRPK